MNESTKNFNGIILSNYQKMYPNLAGFTYDEENDALVYEGNKVKLNGYGLSRIDPIFFQLNPDDIFSYFKNGFYQNAKDSLQISALFDQFIITEEEVSYIEGYAKKFSERMQIYSHNKELIDQECTTNENAKFFAQELLAGKKILDQAKRAATPNGNNAASILYNTYQSNAQSLGREMTLTRKKNDYVPFNEEEYLREIESKSKFGVAGFTSVVLIVLSAVTFGMFLALQLLP